MKGVMIAVAAVYYFLIANFYHQSHGFTKFYDSLYPIWKVVPIVYLVLFYYFHRAGLNERESRLLSLAVFLGGVGDYVIGAFDNGIVMGAFPFGLGHLTYLYLFAHRTSAICKPVLAAVLLWGAFIGHICLMPLLPTQPISVGIMTIYSLTLSSCLIVAASQYIYRSPKDCKEALLHRLIGFGVFVMSDSSLILDHTGHYIPHAEVVILATYYTAQFFILHSFVAQAEADKLKKRN